MVTVEGLEILSGPAEEPISVVMAGVHVKLDQGDGESGPHPDHIWLEEIGIPAAREHAELFTGLCLAQRSYAFQLQTWSVLDADLPVVPVQSIISIEHFDSAGSPVVVPTDRYVLVRNRVRLLTGQSWPEKTAEPARIIFTAGIPPDQIPRTIIAGMLLILGHLYKNREATTDRATFEMPLGAEDLLRPHRILLGMA